MSGNKGKYPVDEDGDMLEYVGYFKDSITWLDMKPFFATLEYKGFQQGRSSVRFIVQDIKTGVTYSLMRNSFDSFIKQTTHGLVRSEFIVVKRGANYGLLMTEDL
jgi:hypothetical protein